MSKLRVGIVFGGRSVEHEVSVASATSILEALDPSRYDVSLLCVDPEGRWRLGGPGAIPSQRVARRRGVAPRGARRRHLALAPRPAAPSAASTSSSRSSTAPAARTAASRASSSSPACPTSGAACSARRSRWTRTSPRSCCAPRASRSCPWVAVRAGEIAAGAEAIADARDPRARPAGLREARLPRLVGGRQQGEDPRRSSWKGCAAPRASTTRSWSSAR